MNKRIIELEKYAEIGRLSPSLLHDVLNPLTGLMLYFDSIEDKADVDLQAKIHLASAIESSKKMREFIKIIQNFIHGQKSETIDVEEIIQNVIKIMSTKARQNNITFLLIRKNKVRTNCPPLFFYQMIINLISNAIDSYDEIMDSRDRYINIILEKEKPNIVIKIVDNGIGLESNKINKIFSPCYTTKEKGTGTGLPTVKNIVEKEFNGKIKIVSKLDCGTTFKILIPLKNPE